ncbi:MAG: MBL fold metallo-hydrolase [Coriobacteriia bacterium]|nr:MBL fold metallo-hydrolase [Coriobacteriia bacterium]
MELSKRAKRFVALAAAGLLACCAFALAACGGGGQTSTNANTNAGANASNEPATAPAANTNQAKETAMPTLTYLGHGSFRITTAEGVVIYVDPFAGAGYDVPADLILVTHEHADHTRTDLMPHAAGCEILRAANFLPSPGNYTTLTSHGITITPVQAYNANHNIDECVGLVLEFDGLRFYAAGDTSTTEDMTSGKLAAMNLDYATLPGDGFYNMGPEEASACAELIGAKHYIPVHLVPVHFDASDQFFSQEVAEQFTAPGRLIVQPGETVNLQ